MTRVRDAQHRDCDAVPFPDSVQPDSAGWFHFAPDEAPIALIKMVNGAISDLRRPDAVLVELDGSASFWCHACGALDACEHTAAASRALDPMLDDSA